MKELTKIELFYFDDIFRCIAQWVLAFSMQDMPVLVACISTVSVVYNLVYSNVSRSNVIVTLLLNVLT